MNVILTTHARDRCREMSIGTKEVKRALREPEMTYTNAEHGTHVAVLGRIAVPFRDDDNGRVALTVLWHGKEQR